MPKSGKYSPLRNSPSIILNGNTKLKHAMVPLNIMYGNINHARLFHFSGIRFIANVPAIGKIKKNRMGSQMYWVARHKHNTQSDIIILYSNLGQKAEAAKIKHMELIIHVKVSICQ